MSCDQTTIYIENTMGYLEEQMEDALDAIKSVIKDAKNDELDCIYECLYKQYPELIDYVERKK